MKKILYTLVIFIITLNLFSQNSISKNKSRSVLVLNAVAHLGNGQVIENSAIGFKEGKITMVADATTARINITDFDITINASGKHVYPGFIAPNSTLGLVEIDAVKASDDEDEIGSINPHIRSIIAYNAESKIIETVRPNGVLIAQITPRGGRVSGTSSIVHLDSWSWQDALIKEDEGLHINFPSTFKRSGWWAEPGIIEPNKEYTKQIEELSLFFSNAKAYLSEKSKEKNLIFESTRAVFNNNQTVYIHANEEKQMIDAIAFCRNFSFKKIVIVGGYESYKMISLLKENNIGVLLRRVHDMPMNDDHDIDLPFKIAKILTDNGVVVGLENSGDMERMNTRNLPFLAGTCVTYGLNKEQALQLITLNSAKLLGIGDTCGSLEIGKDATLFISEGDALDMRTNKLTNAFVQGKNVTLDNNQTALYKKYQDKYKE